MRGPRRPLRVLQSGLIGSDLGDGVYRVLLPLLAVGLTQSPFLVGLVTVATRLPWLIFGLPAGPLLEKVNLRLAMMVSALLRAVAIGGLLLLAATDHLSIGWLVVVATLVGACGVCFDLGSQSVVPRIVTGSELTRANARVHAIQVSMNQLVGPSVGGIVAGTSPIGTLAGLAACYGAVGGWLSRLPTLKVIHPPHGIGQGIRLGLATLWSRTDLRRLAALGAVQNAAYSATIALLVVYVVTPGPVGLSGAGYGLVLTATAFGGLVGSWAGPRLLKRTGPDAWLRVSAVATGIGLALLAVVPSMVAVSAGLFIYGFATMVWNVIVVTHRQQSLPATEFSRVNAAFRWVTWGAMPLGSLLGGAIAEVAGVRATIVVAGLLAAVAGLATPRLGQEPAA